MILMLRDLMHRALIFMIVFTIPGLTFAQTTVFSDDFTTSRGIYYSTANGPVGTSPNWLMSRSGTDFGAGINNGVLSLINDATGSSNIAGWVLAYTNTTAFAAPYTPILANNSGPVTWTFNMRQSRSNPSGPASGYYGNAFILAGTSNTTATTGSGYAVILGNSGSIDPLRLVRYSAGIRTSTNIISSSTSGLTDFGNQYLSVKVVYTPGSGTTANTWQLYVRNDGSTAFQNPATGNLTLQGSAQNGTSTGVSLPIMGAYWNAGIRTAQKATYDNITVSATLPAITSISPTSKVANSGAFTLTVNGTNFSPATVAYWNGSPRTTTYVSPTQLSVAIPATDVTTAGTASVTVVTGTGVSNAEPFVIDPAGVPSISVSASALASLSTVTGTASGNQSFTVNGANLTANVTVTAPANFEVSVNAASGFADAITLNRTGTTLTGQPVTVYLRIKGTAPAGTYSSLVTLATAGGSTRQVAVSGTVLASEPQFQATSLNFTNVVSSGFTVNFTAGSGTNRLVVVKAGSAVNGLPVNGVTYTPSANFGAGSELGTGNYIVYASSGNSVTVTGLTPATTYYVAVYEYNGTAGTQNYKTTSPLTGSRLTPNAPFGLQISTANATNLINFDTTVDGVNNSTFNGGGINPVAAEGELSSNAWAFTGFDTNINFGGASTEDSNYENGISEGGETEGGLYAFEVSPDNFAMGVQPAAGEFAPGTITLRFQNQTNTNITSVSIGYKVYIYNDTPGSNSLNFSHSASATSGYINEAALDQVSPAAADEVPGWKAYYKVITLTGLTVLPNNYYYVRWSGATVSGTVFDEIALDDIVIVANPTTNFASFNGNAQTFTVAGNAQLSGNTAVAGNTTFVNNSWLAIGNNTLTVNNITNSASGGLRGSALSNLIVQGTGTTLNFDQATANTTNLLNSLTIGTSSGIVTVGNNLAIGGTLTVNELQTLNLGTATLSGALTTITNYGTVTTQNTSANPLPAGKNWGGFGTVNLNAATASQTLVTGTYNNVIVNTTGGAVATGNVTVNGTLHLPNANPNATNGSLSTGSNTLFMGPQAVNTGIGDVSGIITRNTGITSNVLYTFGHPNTSILFPPVGTLPTSMSIKTILGQAPAGKTDGVLRTYDFIQTGGTGTKAIITAHYLDSELNGNTENNLVDWVVVVSPLSTIEQSRSNYSTTENWVELANADVAFFSNTFNSKLLTFANSQVQNSVWNGSQSTSWVTAANWTPVGVPSNITKVIIPNAALTPNDPDLNPAVTISSLTIESGGIINAPANSQLTIAGNTGAWINNGTFNAGTGSGVTFTGTDATMAGTTNFNNVTIASGALLRVLTDNTMRIGGTFTKTGTLIAGAINNTIEYTGTNQTIVTPNGAQSAYYNLIISGTGAAIASSSLNINKNLIINQPVNFAGKTVNMAGVEAQTIGGTASPVFTNLVINNTSGQVRLATNTTVSGTLTLTAGILNINTSNLTLGANAVAGNFSATTMIQADEAGVVRRPYTGAGSYLFPIGEGISNFTYSPVSVNITSGTFNNAFVSVNLNDAVHPNNYSTPGTLTRYWNVTQTGITNAVATITANYVTGDAVGGEAALSAAQLNGTFNAISNGWIKFGGLSGNVLVAENALLTPGVKSVFTGITAQNPVIEVFGQGDFCQNEVVTLTSSVTGGTAPYTYQWSGGLGNAATATPPTAIAGTTNYTLTVRDSNGIAATSAPLAITITAPASGGTLSGNQAICEGIASTVTVSGYTGNIIRWERSANIQFTNPVFINNTTATLTGTQIGNVNATTYIRAVLQSGSCPVVYSNVVQITVSSTIYQDGVWSNGLPDTAKAAIIRSDYTATANINACSMQVANGANVVIPSGLTVTLNGKITVSSGSFTLQNNANLIQLSDVQNSGNIIVEKNSQPLYRLDYSIWSAPVTGTKTLLEFSPATAENRFYDYNTEFNYYDHVNPNLPFVTGKGYLIRMPNTDSTPGYNNQETPITFSSGFVGVPNNGTINVPLSTQYLRYNGVGNPYPSPINVHAFFDANSSALDQDGAIYFWRKRNNSANPSYATITKLAYNANTAGGDLGSDAFNGLPSTWVINSGQGFIVKAQPGAAALTFNNSMRRAVNNNQFFRNGEENQNEMSRYWLNITGTDEQFGQTTVGYTPYTTKDIDFGWDGKGINDSDVTIYTVAANVNLAIQARDNFNTNDVVTLGYNVAAAGSYTVNLAKYDGLFTTLQAIYIKDKVTGTIHNLKDGAYSFVTEAGIFTDRFDIIYTTEVLNNDKFVNPETNVIVWKKDAVININSGATIIKDVTIYDIMGRVLYTKSGINAPDIAINDLVSQQQMIIVEVITPYGKVSKKVIY